MTSAYLTDAFRSLTQSTAVLNSLSFPSTNILPRAVLSSEDFFETHLIRDAAPHELALFEPSPATTDFVGGQEMEELARAEGGGEKWTAAKRKAPQRVAAKERPSPLKERRRQTTAAAAGVDEPDRCLRAAKKLLDIYTMPRATEHVFALHSQWVGVVDSISELEETLRRPPSRPTPQPQHSDSYYRLLELEDAIKREQLEIFALEQLKAEKEAEAAAARKPAPGPAARKVPSVVANAQRSATRTAKSSAELDPVPPPAEGEGDPTFDPFAKSNVLEKKQLQKKAGAPPVLRSPSSAGAEKPTARKPAAAGTKRVPSVVAAAKRSRPSVGASSSSPQESRSKTPTPRSSLTAADGGDSTPKAARIAPAPVPAVAPSPPAPSKPTVSLPEGVTPGELDLATQTVWAGLGEGAGLKGWGRKWAAEQDGKAGVVEELEKEAAKVDTADTISILNYALSSSVTAAASSDAPGSPSAGSITSFSTLTSAASTDPSAAPSPWSPAQIVEAQLLLLLLCTLTSTPLPSPTPSSPTDDDLPPLLIILRDPLPTGSSSDKTPCLSMAALKAHLGAFANERNWAGEMGTTAVYALVSKGCVRICRRGREGAAVGIRT
ncbi:hypothetical protein JCM6882_006035 [Rhodosporidiobolus microsporus]